MDEDVYKQAVKGERSFTALVTVSEAHMTLLGSRSTHQVAKKEQHETLHEVLVAWNPMQ